MPTVLLASVEGLMLCLCVCLSGFLPAQHAPQSVKQQHLLPVARHSAYVSSYSGSLVTGNERAAREQGAGRQAGVTPCPAPCLAPASPSVPVPRHVVF